VAAYTSGKHNLDDVHEACEAHLYAIGYSCVPDDMQKLRTCVHEACEVDNGLRAVGRATEVKVRHAQGLKSSGHCEHGKRALGGVKEKYTVVVVAAHIDGDMTKVLPCVPDLVEK
jgi:hypothetical protein